MTNPSLQFLNPSGLNDPSKHNYTHVAIASPSLTTIYISGQYGANENGELVSPNFNEQLEQSFTNLRIALTEAGASPENVAKTTMLVVEHDESKLPLLGQQMEAMWGDKPPACTLIPVPRLALDGMLFEIEAIAVIESSH
ncbi:MAG: RidA family protein [Xenococcaceae cyanobacterium MO_207.B15]|nr:RidA family protein [Xenococcaceae cyanobacterium MO_207.B15]